jgi:hypothetical protein
MAFKAPFTMKLKSFNTCLWASVLNFIRMRQKINKTGQNVIYARDICLSLNRFSRNSQPLSGIRRRASTPNFTQIGQEMLKLRVEIHLRRSVKCDYQRADFHETQGLFDNSLQTTPTPNFMIIRQTV